MQTLRNSRTDPNAGGYGPYKACGHREGCKLEAAKDLLESQAEAIQKQREILTKLYEKTSARDSYGEPLIGHGFGEADFLRIRAERAEARVAELEIVLKAAQAFLSQPYDNGQWERRLQDAVRKVTKR